MAEEKRMELSAEQAIGLLQNERAKLNALEERLGQFQGALEETLRAKEAIQAIQETAMDEAILVPLGAGVYAAGKLTENKTVLTTLGGGIIKTYSLAQALSQLEARQKEAEQNLSRIRGQLEETVQNVNSLTRAIQAGQRQLNAQKNRK